MVHLESDQFGPHVCQNPSASPHDFFINYLSSCPRLRGALNRYTTPSESIETIIED